MRDEFPQLESANVEIAVVSCSLNSRGNHARGVRHRADIDQAASYAERDAIVRHDDAARVEIASTP
jgi:hypothetical protein